MMSDVFSVVLRLGVVLLLVALVCMAVIWMFLQSPKTFISAYNGLLPSAGTALNQGRGLPNFNINVPAGEHSVLGAPSIDVSLLRDFRLLSKLEEQLFDRQLTQLCSRHTTASR